MVRLSLFFFRRKKTPQEKRLQRIVKLRKKGLTFQQIGDIYGVSRQRVHRILNPIRKV